MANITKKTESVLGLAPVEANGLGLSPFQLDRQPANKEEARIIAAQRREKLTMDLIADKGQFGMMKMGQVQEVATSFFGSTLNTMFAERDRFRGTEAQPYVEEFTIRQVQMYAHHMLGTLEVVGNNIGMEVHRSLNLPPEQLSLWQRLFGR